MRTKSQKSNSTRIVLADRERPVRDAVRALVTQVLDMCVVGEAATAADLQREVGLHRPDLAIVDWDLVVGRAGAPLKRLRDAAPALHIVVLGLRPGLRRLALSAGADDFVSKIDDPETVVGVLQRWQRDGSSADEERTGAATDDPVIDGRGGPR